MSDLIVDPGTPATTAAQGAPPEDALIENHGNLLLFVKAVAKNWGYEAHIENQDIDPLETEERGYTYKVPGRGDIVLDRDGDGICLEYRLPEYGRQVFADIAAAIDGERRDRDRRAGKSGPLVIGG